FCLLKRHHQYRVWCLKLHPVDLGTDHGTELLKSNRH
ncbi:uncharacterized protein METZ01_LOCUS237503, partial [marine metagenome]